MHQRIVSKVPRPAPAPIKLLRVAAYARVSSGKDAMLQSLAAQVSYYSDFIQKRAGWQFAGIYSDEALTGTKENRDGFQRLLADCRAGKIDLVITKSVTRFARNTVTLLETVRELKALGIEVWFEKENLKTLSANGEFMLSILASFAQEESYSVSENCKWRMRRKFQRGIPNNLKMLGYRLVNGELHVEPKEAEIVRGIFSDYLAGMGKNAIMKKLAEQGVRGRFGKTISESNVIGILRNEKYCGDLVLQKSYSNNHIDKKLVKNTGELPMYEIPNNHEAIIDRETFDRVQAELDRRTEAFAPPPFEQREYPFTSIMICDQCGKHYRRKIVNAGSPYEKPAWICSTFNQWGKAHCSSKQIPEDILLATAAETLGLDTFDDAMFTKMIQEVHVPAANRLVFLFRDGRAVEKEWRDKSRAWSEEAKQRAREKELARRNGGNQP